MAIVYPTTLPCPLLGGNSSAGGSSFERSNFDFATRQRATFCGDYLLGFDFVAETDQQMKDFKDFYYNMLFNGSKTFNADWKIEGDTSVKSFRFADNYSVSHLGVSKYKISASFEMITKIKDL